MLQRIPIEALDILEQDLNQYLKHIQMQTLQLKLQVVVQYQFAYHARKQPSKLVLKVAEVASALSYRR